jgi:hypothetical protein
LTSADDKTEHEALVHKLQRQRLRRLGAKLLSIKVIQLIALLAAGSFALFELTLTRLDRRVDASLQYAERFTEGAVAEQRRTLDRAWYARAADVSALRQVTSSEAPSALAAFQAFFRRDILRANNGANEVTLKLAIAEIADTLDQLALCVQPPDCSPWCAIRARCDAATARQHFCEYALSFTNLYEAVLEEIQQELGTAELGVSARLFATSKECQP